MICRSPRRREAFESFQSSSEVVGGDETGEMLSELVVALIVEAPDGGVLDGAVHSLDLTVGPRMLGPGGAVLDVVLGAGVFESMGPEALAVGDGLFDERHGRTAGAWGGELDAVAHQELARRRP